MSLQVWLPLNGDLRNQGLSDLTFTGSGVTLTTNDGKMGSCYSSAGSGYIVSDKKINLGQKQSMFCWIKPAAFNSSASLTGVCGQHRYSNCTGLGITLAYVSASTGYLCFTWGNGNERKYSHQPGTKLLNANTWYHVGYTYDGTTVKLYVNGELDKSYTISGISTPDDYFQCFMWSLNGGGGNNAVYTNYGLNGRLNDVRAYDHVLSDKEIKELSKGLMLHYTFNRDDYSAITNLFTTPAVGIPYDTANWDSSLHKGAVEVSGWTAGCNPGVPTTTVGYHAYWTDMNGIAAMVFPKLNYNISGISASRWLGISTSIALSSNTTYTVSFEAMANVEGRVIHGGYHHNNGSATDFHGTTFHANNIPVGKWKKYAFTFTLGTVAATGSYYFYGMEGSNGIAYIRNPQLEIGTEARGYVKGSKAKDTIIYDSSGMGHNGTITGTIGIDQEEVNTTIDGSKTRSVEKTFYSTYFNGSTYVAYDTQMAIPDAYTISFWIYKLKGGHAIDWRDANDNGSQPVYFNPDTNKIQYHTSAGGSAYFDYVFNNSKWYHIAIAVTSTTGTLYVNGVKQQTVNIVNTPGTIARFHVGCRQNYINIMPMFMRDLRVYATTLSDADVKQIYATPFIVDNEQNIFMRELREGSGE